MMEKIFVGKTPRWGMEASNYPTHPSYTSSVMWSKFNVLQL